MRLNQFFRALTLAFLLVVHAACSRQETPTAVQPTQTPAKVSLRQAWFPWCGYAGELVAADRFDTTNGIELEVRKGADDIDPIKLVIGGDSDFGVAAAETVIGANLKGADLHIIGVINYKSPTCYLALEKANVRSFAEFKGKRLGVLTGTETETVSKLLKLKGVIDPSTKEVEVPFDLASFIAGDVYDIRPAYIYDEPISLDAQGLRYTLLKPDDYVTLISGVYFTTGLMLREHPERVRGIVFALAQGWAEALAHPQDAIDRLAAYDRNVDRTKELRSLDAGREYFAGESGRVLWASPDRLKAFGDAMVALKLADSEADVRKWIDLSYVDEYHRQHAAGERR